MRGCWQHLASVATAGIKPDGGQGSYLTLFLFSFPLEIEGMDHNGARSNPRLQVELSRLSLICERLLVEARARALEPRPAPLRASPVLETVTRVLELAELPMRAREIHAAAEQLAGEPLLWTSVKGTLATYASGERPRFRRVRHGVYRLAGR